MQLIINYPNNELGIKEFRLAFAEVQKELILQSIKDLKLSVSSKEKILHTLINELKEKI